jgi:hypothetical protein
VRLRRSALGLAALAVLALPPAGAAAHGDGPTADGRCTLSGALTLEPPLGGLPAPTRYDDVATGTCTGTLNGEPVTNEPVELAGQGEGTLSCLGGSARSSGTLRYTRGTPSEDDDVVFPYTAESAGAMTQFVSRTVTPDAVAVGRIDFLPYGSMGTVDDCAGGRLATARYDATIETVSRDVHFP